MKKIKFLDKVPYWIKALVLFVAFPIVLFGIIIWVLSSRTFKKKNRTIAY